MRYTSFLFLCVLLMHHAVSKANLTQGCLRPSSAGLMFLQTPVGWVACQKWSIATVLLCIFSLIALAVCVCSTVVISLPVQNLHVFPSIVLHCIFTMHCTVFLFLPKRRSPFIELFCEYGLLLISELHLPLIQSGLLLSCHNCLLILVAAQQSPHQDAPLFFSMKGFGFVGVVLL